MVSSVEVFSQSRLGRRGTLPADASFPGWAVEQYLEKNKNLLITPLTDKIGMSHGLHVVGEDVGQHFSILGLEYIRDASDGSDALLRPLSGVISSSLAMSRLHWLGSLLGSVLASQGGFPVRAPWIPVRQVSVGEYRLCSAT